VVIGILGGSRFGLDIKNLGKVLPAESRKINKYPRCSPRICALAKKSGAEAPLMPFTDPEYFLAEKPVRQPAQHHRPLNLRFKEGNDGAHPIAEGLPDLLHVLVLHLYPVAHEFR